MAMMAVLTGGFSGFVTFLVSWLGFGLGILTAGGLYLVVGLAVACIVLSLGALPPTTRQAQTQSA